MCGETKTFVIKKLCECLENRRDTMKKIFKIIQKDESIDVKTYEKIIDIKMKLIEDKINDSIYEEINSLYQKIIEVLASSNGNDFKKYLEKLQNFINKYDQLKNKANVHLSDEHGNTPADVAGSKELKYYLGDYVTQPYTNINCKKRVADFLRVRDEKESR